MLLVKRNREVIFNMKHELRAQPLVKSKFVGIDQTPNTKITQNFKTEHKLHTKFEKILIIGYF